MMFSVRHLGFGYGSRRIFHGVNLDLPTGSICGVLGVNGAGKSTLLKCLNRILEPDKGDITLKGRDIRSMGRRHIARSIAYVPQSSSATPLTVFDTVLLGRKPYIKWGPSAHDMDLVETLLTTMDLSHLALRPTHMLSGGELQKVTIARALAQEPDLILMDEPTSSLDLKNQIAVMTLIHKTVSQETMSAVVTMHDLNQAFRYADYFLMLKEGRVHAFCPKKEVTPEMIGEVYGVEVLFEQIQNHTVVVPRERPSPGERRRAFKIAVG